MIRINFYMDYCSVKYGNNPFFRKLKMAAEGFVQLFQFDFYYFCTP